MLEMGVSSLQPPGHEIEVIEPSDFEKELVLNDILKLKIKICAILITKK